MGGGSPLISSCLMDACILAVGVVAQQTDRWSEMYIPDGCQGTVSHPGPSEAFAGHSITLISQPCLCKWGTWEDQ